MNLIWVEDQDELAECAADQVVSLSRQKPDAVIALPTGRTPLRMYARLRHYAQYDGWDANHLRLFNLDEFVGLGIDDPRSYAAYLQAEVLHPLGIAQSRLLNGLHPDPTAECQAHEMAIRAIGGLDLAILGLGANGHLAFNEPATAADAGSRVVSLTAQTINDHQSHQTPAGPAPHTALTLGLKVLLESQSVLLLVSGQSKAAALSALRRGIADTAWPVSLLHDHPQLTVIASLDARATT